MHEWRGLELSGRPVIEDGGLDAPVLLELVPHGIADAQVAVPKAPPEPLEGLCQLDLQRHQAASLSEGMPCIPSRTDGTSSGGLATHGGLSKPELSGSRQAALGSSGVWVLVLQGCLTAQQHSLLLHVGHVRHSLLGQRSYPLRAASRQWLGGVWQRVGGCSFTSDGGWGSPRGWRRDMDRRIRVYAKLCQSMMKRAPCLTLASQHMARVGMAGGTCMMTFSDRIHPCRLDFPFVPHDDDTSLCCPQ